MYERRRRGVVIDPPRLTRRTPRDNTPYEPQPVPARAPRGKGKPPRRKSWRFLLGGIAAVLLATVLARSGVGRQPPSPSRVGAVTPAPSSTSVALVPRSVATAVSRAINPSGSTGAVESLHAIVDPLQGTYGIYIEDLTSGAHFGINDERPFIAASVIKLTIAVALYQAEAEGTVKFATKVTPTDEQIRGFGTGSIRYDAPGTSYTIDDLLMRLIRQSDNSAAAILTDLLGADKIQQRIQAWGLTQTYLKEDISTAADMGKLLRLIYQHKVLTPARSLDLMGLMTDTDFEDRLPKPLPKYVQVPHKIGTEANGVINDVGIVVLPGHPYSISVFSDGTPGDEGTTTLQKISQAVFNYEVNVP